MERERELIIAELNKLEKLMSGINLDKLLPKPPKSSYRFKKNKNDSIAYRAEGNRIFRQKKHNQKSHKQIWKNYTLGVAFAPADSVELSLCYANRCALLLHLRKYEECLQDIEAALKITKSCDLKVKLLCRAVECQVALQQGKQRSSYERAKYWLNQVEDIKNKKELFDKVRKIEKIIESNHRDYKVRIKNPDLHDDDLYYWDDILELKYSEEHGRHLVTNEDLPTRASVFIEEFYVTSPNGRKNFAVCNHCLSISWALRPCEGCTYALYCSDECKNEAREKYHDVECSTRLAAYCHEDALIQLSVRAFIIAFKEAGSTDNLKIITNEALKNKKTKNFLDRDKFFANNIRSLMSFGSPKKIKVYYPKRAINGLLHLALNENFVDELNLDRNLEIYKNENAIFIASTLLKLITIFSINAFSVIEPSYGCKKKKCTHSCHINLCCSRGFGFAPLSSLFNHNCDCNVSKYYTNDGRVGYYTLRTLAKGEQLFVSYYGNFMESPCPVRQQFLFDVYEFKCECIACEEEWETFDDLKEKILVKPLENLSGEDYGFSLFKKHFSIIRKLQLKDHRCREKTIRNFIEDLKKLRNMETQESFYAQAFLLTFIKMMEKRYGTILRIPSKCKYEN